MRGLGMQRWAGRLCLLLVAGMGMMGFHFANIRFLPMAAGFAIMAGVCYSDRGRESSPLRGSGEWPIL